MIRRFAILTGIALMMLASCNSGKEQVEPVPFNHVSLHDGFWKERINTVIGTTVPHSIRQSETALERFRRCSAFLAGKETPLPETNRFISSDLYKVMEGTAYSLMYEKNDSLEAFMDYAISLIGKSQLADGYLYISHECGNPNIEEMGPRPYSWVVHSHELYNVGHLYEAAVAYYMATGKRSLLDIAVKSADHVNRVFFQGDPGYNDGKPVNQAPGHEEIELALCKMYSTTGNGEYLKMAKKFLDIRGVTYVPSGDGIMSPSYAQQHLPVREQREPAGHAVRAGYLYTAMAMVDALTAKEDYRVALDSIWNNLTETRIHITGGLGAVFGIEGFGAPYELPNKNAYNETCAAVANVFFNHAMFLATHDAKYMDLAEVSLYNNALAGINIAGNRFFYVNPLEADGTTGFNHGAAGRTEWFGCACCPPNITRLILQVAGMMYSHSGDEIYVMMYGNSDTDISLKKTDVKIIQETDYPFDGKLRIRINPEQVSRFSMKIRIPTWSRTGEFMPGDLYRYVDEAKELPSIFVNGRETTYAMDKGFASITREWKTGDIIELDLGMEARQVTCNPAVKENIGRAAIVRGPMVYCAEETDTGCPVQEISISGKAKGYHTVNEGILKGITVIGLPVMTTGETSPDLRQRTVELIPYYAWDNRGDGKSMAVWLKTELKEN